MLSHAMPWTMFAMSCVASPLYLVEGDWRRAGYWAAAAAITFFVTV